MVKKEQETKNILSEWVYKPNQLISALAYEGTEADSKFINLSVNKRKIMNVLIQAVHNHFEKGLEGELFKVSLRDIRERAGMENYSIPNTVKEVEGMMSVAFETKYKKAFDRVILFTRIKYDGEDYVAFECNKHLTNIIKNEYCLLDRNGDVLKLEDDKKKHHYYSRLNVELESMFRGKEHAKALIMYEIAVHNLKNIKTRGSFVKDLDELLEIMGCVTYAKKNSDVINKILLPVVEDLKRVGIQLFYKCETKSNGKIKNIRFSITFAEGIDSYIKNLHRGSNGGEFYWDDYQTNQSKIFYFKSEKEYEVYKNSKLTNVEIKDSDNYTVEVQVEDTTYYTDEELEIYWGD